ncbi:MAG: DNA alkylation repair protein [Actinobacteria bacterium]|nr:DNA alkylation repair protein [Actinomycetota bacterium]
MLASSAINELKKRSNKSQAIDAQRFFKTAKGEYGYGDIFIGVKVPVIRQIARKYQLLSLPEIEKLISSKLHEVRLCGLVIITMQFKRAKGEVEQKRLFEFYLKQIKQGRVNNWDLVDVTAPIMGGYLIPRSDSMQLLKKLAKSKDLWQRRSAILFTFAYIRKRELKPTITIVKMLIDDQHDLIQKASGWALREVGKKNLALLRSFLKDNSQKMGRTSLRYAIERLPNAERKRWLDLK